jgi:lipid-binding SYLF domain-containing protein
MRHLLAVVLLFALNGVALARDESKETERLESAAEVITEIMGTPEKSIPQDLLNRAVCVGIIPSMKKAAFVFGGSYGRGCLVCRRGGNGAWSAPSMITLRGGSFGFQIGGSATDIVLIVMNAKGAEKLLKSKSELGADASVAGGPVGRTASGSTDLTMHAEILTYSRSRGVFAGISLKGAALTQDSDGNERLYGQKVDPRDILIAGKVSPPAAARALDSALAKYSPKGGEPFPNVK